MPELSEEFIDVVRAHMTYEQAFTHRVFTDCFFELSPKDQEDVLAIVYANYLIRGRLLAGILEWSAKEKVAIPNFADLLAPGMIGIKKEVP